MTLTEERAEDEKERDKSMRRTVRAVAESLRNEDGIERLLAIPDDQWEEAVLQSQEDGDAS